MAEHLWHSKSRFGENLLCVGIVWRFCKLGGLHLFLLEHWVGTGGISTAISSIGAKPCELAGMRRSRKCSSAEK